MGDRSFADAMDAFDAWTLVGGNGSLEDFRRALRRVQTGIPREVEFAALARWGGAKIVSPLGQRRGYSDPGEFVPDLFVLASVRGKEVPFFVEVKSTLAEDDRVPLSEKYVSKMLSFQRAVGLPVLVAAKFRLGLWVLREVSTLSKARTAYRMTLEDMKESLMGLLLEDKHLSVEPNSGLVLELSRSDGESASTPGSAHFTVSHAFVEGRNGRAIGAVPFLLAFLSAAQAVETESFDGPTYRLEARAMPAEVDGAGREMSLGVTTHQVMSAHVQLVSRDDVGGWSRLVEDIGQAPPPSAMCDDLLAAGLVHIVGTVKPASRTVHFEGLR